MPEIAIPLFISLAFFALARVLTPKAPGKKPATIDDLRISTSKLGTVVPFIMGSGRLSPNITWYGNLKSKLKKSGGGKGRSSTKTYYYYLDVMEVICTGPIDSIDAVFLDEDKTSFSSSSFVTDKIDTTVYINGSDCRVIFMRGSSGQPVLAELSSRLIAVNGPSTAYPFFCYALWIQGAMGTGLNWNNLNYKVTRYPTYTINGVLDAKVYGNDGSFGVNPAFAIIDILLNPLLGNTYQRSDIDEDALYELYLYFKQEKIYLNFIIDSSTDREQILNALCTDLGILNFVRNGKLVFRLLRTTNKYKTLRDTTSSLLIETPQIETSYIRNQGNNQIYKFKDENLNYKESQVQDMDLASMNNNQQRIYQEKSFDFISSQEVARRLLDLQKALTANNIPVTQFKVPYRDVYVEPGYKVRVDNKDWRVLRTEEQDNNLLIDVIADRFRYSNLNVATNFGFTVITPILEPIVGLNSTTTLNTIVEAMPFELSWEANEFDEGITLGVAAIRPNLSIIEAEYLGRKTVDTTGIYYSKIASPIFAEGMKVNSTDTSYVYLDLLHTDQDPVTELEITDQQWEDNRILALVNQELISIKKFETSLSSDYKIAFDSLKRGRLGTEEQTTFTTDSVFFFGDPVTLNQDTDITTGSIEIKILTQTTRDKLALGDTIPLSYNITGIAQNPLPAENLAGTRTSPSNINFTWDLYEKGPAGKVLIPVTSVPTYSVLYSMNGTNWTTKSAPYTSMSITSGGAVTLYIKTYIPASSRSSVKRFKTVS